MPKLQRSIGSGMERDQRFVMLWRLSKFHCDRFISAFLDPNRMTVERYDRATEKLNEMVEALKLVDPDFEIDFTLTRGLTYGRALMAHVNTLEERLDAMIAYMDEIPEG